MDSRSLVLLLLLVCLMFLHDTSDLTRVHAHVPGLPTRKMMMMKEGTWEGANGEEEKEMKMGLGLHEELRTVPSGPDPLHHHVNPPRQPRNYSNLP